MATSTSTAVIDPQVHYVVVQFAAEDGYRFWSNPVPESEASAVIAQYEEMGYVVDDYDNAAACACTECEARNADWERIINKSHT